MEQELLEQKNNGQFSGSRGFPSPVTLGHVGLGAHGEAPSPPWGPPHWGCQKTREQRGLGVQPGLPTPQTGSPAAHHGVTPCLLYSSFLGQSCQFGFHAPFPGLRSAAMPVTPRSPVLLRVQSQRRTEPPAPSPGLSPTHPALRALLNSLADTFLFRTQSVLIPTALLLVSRSLALFYQEIKIGDALRSPGLHMPAQARRESRPLL